MSADAEKYGRTEIAPIHVLEPVALDFSNGQPLLPGLGQTETPITVLPVWTIDMGEPAPTPRLVLTLRLRPDATAAGVAVDLVRAWRTLDEYERGLNGSGLNPGEASDEQTAEVDIVRWVLTATDPTGAADRLAKVVEAINGADPAVAGEPLTGRSFSRCEAELRTAA